MCGLGGYAGIQSEAFTRALGFGLDDRGGHAAGWVTDKAWATREGMWFGSRRKFTRRASEGRVGILHSRFATCGSLSQADAHPFRIARPTRVLYGAHNGCIYDAEASAKEHRRRYSVDSREMFELLADDQHDAIAELSGYGVASWLYEGQAAVQLARLSHNSEIMIVSVEGGGFAWASTWEILGQALHSAGLVAKVQYELEIGTVYRITPDAIVGTTEEVKLASPSWSRTSYGWLNDDELDQMVKASNENDELDSIIDRCVAQDDSDCWDEDASLTKWERTVGQWAK